LECGGLPPLSHPQSLSRSTFALLAVGPFVIPLALSPEGTGAARFACLTPHCHPACPPKEGPKPPDSRSLLLTVIPTEAARFSLSRRFLARRAAQRRDPSTTSDLSLNLLLDSKPTIQFFITAAFIRLMQIVPEAKKGFRL